MEEPAPLTSGPRFQAGKGVAFWGSRTWVKGFGASLRFGEFRSFLLRVCFFFLCRVAAAFVVQCLVVVSVWHVEQVAGVRA